MNKVIDENYYDLIINNNIVPSYDTGDNITYINDINSILHVYNDRNDPCDLGRQPYHRFPSIFTLESDLSLEKSNIGKVQRTPYLGLYGLGVIIGIIDTGIDYEHPAFRHNDGSTRILNIWDQSIQDGKVPEGFTFGSEYSSEQINIALKTANPLELVPTRDTNGHGTAIASIIAGKESAGDSFAGVVPDSEIVVVKLKEAKRNLHDIFFISEDAVCYQESDILLGLRYLITISQQLKRPLAICVALGTSQSGHDGRGATTSYLDFLSRISRIGIAIPAGNEGNAQRHYFGNASSSLRYEEFELRVDEKDKLFWMEIWPDPLARLAVEIITPTGESTKYIYPSKDNCVENNFIYSKSVVWVNNITIEEETGNQLILVRFRDPIPGVWRFRVDNIEEEAFSFNVWLPNGELISKDTYFLNPDPNTTITESGNGKNLLTVTAYNQETDSILLQSGRGYTRSGVIKPDIAAPGYNLSCALPNNRYGTLTGTGAAAAHTVGIIAMILEWAVVRGNYTSITGSNINTLIIRGARRKDILVYPNNIWGYGEIDAYNLFIKLSI
uniref:S8 family peptidase n=1 Tax=Anaerosporobacter sp. TaxID=1872529 RepID=UPI000ECF3150|nr:S8 family peptidase [Anaerosporobacter sp.]HAB60625.1 peptidase S8 [Lachnospiraceae bacterium]